MRGCGNDSDRQLQADFNKVKIELLVSEEDDTGCSHRVVIFHDD